MTTALKNETIIENPVSLVDLFGMEYDFIYIYTYIVYNYMIIYINKTFPHL